MKIDLVFFVNSGISCLATSVNAKRQRSKKRTERGLFLLLVYVDVKLDQKLKNLVILHLETPSCNIVVCITTTTKLMSVF